MWVRWRKKAYRPINNNFCVYFTHSPRSPSWRNFHQILHDWSPRRDNQSCQILSQSGQKFWFCRGSNFWISHKNEKSPLTQGLSYRWACDGEQKLLGGLSSNFFGWYVHDVITLFKFADDRFKGFWLADGQSLHFPIDFEGRLYNPHTIVWGVILEIRSALAGARK